MTEQLREAGSDLALILGRVSALKGGGEPAPGVDAGAEEIPLLTEAYEGPPVFFAEHEFVESAPPEQVNESNAGLQQQSDEQIENILAEMIPLIQVEVKKAVLQELVKVDKELCARLEADLVRLLRERLESSI